MVSDSDIIRYRIKVETEDLLKRKRETQNNIDNSNDDNILITHELINKELYAQKVKQEQAMNQKYDEKDIAKIDELISVLKKIDNGYSKYAVQL